MTAALTIQLSDDVLKALKSAKSITVELGAAGNGSAPRAGAKKDRGDQVGNGLRPGSHGARLVAWASGRKRPFGVRDVMKALRIKRGHASMLLTAVMRRGGVKRVGRGEYAAVS
jgi:hypothetical protein